MQQIIKGSEKTRRRYQNLSRISISITEKIEEDWKKFEVNNKEIALNILFAPHNKEEIWPAYISKYNHKRKIQVILLMITDDGK